MSFRFCIISAMLILCGCTPPGPARKPTVAVTGEVYSQGKPAADVAVTLHDRKGMDKDLPSTSSAMTDQNGKFFVSTYEAGDGAPEGEYTVTFSWGQINRISMQYEGDKFKGKYSSPDNSKFQIKVEKGKPVDMGRIELEP